LNYATLEAHRVTEGSHCSTAVTCGFQLTTTD